MTTDRKSTAICRWLGEISYPLYITHYPVMYMQMSWVKDHADAPVWIHVLLNLGVIFISVVIARGLLKVYDEPVRKWLTENWLKGKKQATARTDSPSGNS